MIKSLQSYFKARGWKVGNNKPSTTTAIGQFAHEVWEKLYSAKVTDVEAIKSLMEKRNEVNKK